MSIKIGAIIPTLNEWRWMPAVTGQLLKVVDRCLVLRGTRAMSGSNTPPLVAVPTLDPRVELIEGSWPTEHDTRNAGMDLLSDCDYVFIVDSDEIYSENALKLLRTGCEKGYRALSCRFLTYWKTPAYRIDPPENLVAVAAVRKDVRFTNKRMFDGELTFVNWFLFHHLSYVRTDDELKEKLATFAHASEVVPGWYENKWKAWDSNHTLEDLHPTHPDAYKRTAPVIDDGLYMILKSYGCTWETK